MSYSEKIRKELFNDKAFQALYAGVKPEEREKIEGVLNDLLRLADGAISGFSSKMSDSSFTKEEIEAAVSDRSGRK